MFAADIYDDAGTGHNGPQCTACGYTFCAYCPTDYKGRTGDDRWDSECTPRVAT